MAHHRSWGLVAVGFVIVGLLVAIASYCARFQSEPVYADRSLSEWLVDLDYSHRPRDLLASNAVHQMGAAAVLPHLGPMLRAEDSPMKLRLLGLLSKIGLKTDFVPANRRRERASRACRVLGPAAAQYLPELTAMLDSLDRVTAWCGHAAIMDVKPRAQWVSS